MSSLLHRICRLSKQTLRLLRPRRSLFTFMVFLVLSGLFWLSTALNESYDCEVKIPLSVENLPKNVVLTSEVEDTLKVVVHDKGYTLLQYLYGDKVKKITLSLASLSKQSEKYVVSAAELQRMVKKQFYNSSTVMSIKPERLEVGYTHGTAKSVVVRLLGDITPAPDYYLSHVQITPDRVTVYSSKEVLDSIKYVLTERLAVRNFSDTVSRTVAIKAIGGARVSPKTVRVDLYPDILTEETVEVPIIAVNLPDGVNLRTFPSRVKVKFTVGVSQYRSVNTSQFRVEADYMDIQPGTDKCHIRIAQMPNGITKASLEFNEVDYLIEN